jgi:DNA helicase-2/ATP-dependent DNA helicase PcrA
VEADHVARYTAALVTRRVARHGDFAVLFRTGPQARAYEEAFRARGIPYVLIGGKSFFDRKEVRDVIAYLKLLVQPDDELSFARALDAPPRGVGPKSLERVLAHAARGRLTLAQAFEEAATLEGVSEAAATAGRDFCRLLASLRADTSGTLIARIERLLAAVGYKAEVERLYPDPLERTRRWAAVEEVLTVARKYSERKKKPTMEGFLQALTLQEQDDDDESDPAERKVVTLMTLHSAKGLEFPRVYLVGVEEGLLPHQRSAAEGGVEEERRLCYVAITRAQQELTISCTKSRSKFGARIESMPSRFLYELLDEKPPKGWLACDERTAQEKRADAGSGRKPQRKSPARRPRRGPTRHGARRGV